jgi:hypothetical protein
MYGDLFGDLPEAKKSTATNFADAVETNPASSSSATNHATEISTATKETVKQQQQVQSSIVKSIGKSGTAVAFVPLAALKQRKRPLPSSKTTFKSSVDTLKSVKTPSAAAAPITKKQSPVFEEHAALFESLKEADASAAPISSMVPTKDSQPHLEDTNVTRSTPSTISQLSEEHRQRLRQQAMDDPYDPMVPNDLLQYWERKAVTAERERLERERLDQLQVQQDLRQRLEIERRELEREGNVDKLMENERQRGMGRGVSNLPAWMVAKQKHESSIGDAAP